MSETVQTPDSNGSAKPATERKRTKPDPVVGALTRIGKVLNTLDPVQRQKVLAFHSTAS